MRRVTSKQKQLTLYSRTYCHLCDDMLAALETLRSEFSFTVAVVDVDADPALEAKYDELVPVLVAEDQELCHYFLDEAAVRAFLAAR
ncbi:MAG: glutaredoxin family protein [Rhodocyclaceae bacterium]|nr:MAG: glutaredoxin family protein [Rhodocyclaceae bacterium]